MPGKVFLILSSFIVCCCAQRPFYAGFRPIGYPNNGASSNIGLQSDLGDRLSNEATVSSTMSTTTIRLPIEALGDKDLVDRLNKLPADKQPFWLLNWKALEDQRKNPQNYEHRPSFFNPNSFGK